MSTATDIAQVEERLRAKVKASRGLGLQTVSAVLLTDIEALLDRPTTEAPAPQPTAEPADVFVKPTATGAPKPGSHMDVAAAVVSTWIEQIFADLQQRGIPIYRSRWASNACTCPWPWPHYGEHVLTTCPEYQAPRKKGR